MDLFLSVLLDTCTDTLKLLPFLFLTYLLLELLERKSGSHSAKLISNSRRFGPMIGGLLGVVPQCGFSAIASEFYSRRIITLGTLLAIYLSTSDEMLPILISERTSVHVIVSILLIKLLIGIAAGFVIDLFTKKQQDQSPDFDLDRHRKSHPDSEAAEESRFLPEVLSHTFQTLLFIFLVTFAVDAFVAVIGTDSLSGFILNRPVIGEILAGLIGLIPNCSASVIITQLYLEGAMQTGAIMTGLLVSAGIGPLMLWRTNPHRKENLAIYALLYIISVICGILIEFSGIIL